MKVHNLIIIPAVIICFFLSCTKDKINPDCYDFPPAPRGQGYEPVFDYPRFGTIDINPNNPDEIIYGLFTEVFGVKKIIKFNLESKNKQVVFSGDIFDIDWGENDWIILRLGSLSSQIWKIKSNGDSLTQLTFGESHFQPEWNSEGDQFVCSLFGTGNKIYDKDGNLIKHFPNLNLNNMNWQHPDFILSHSTNIIYAFHPQDSTFADIYIPEEPISNGNIEFLPNQDEFIWVNGNVLPGIYRTDFNTGLTTIIKESCDSKKYLKAVYSPKTEKIIALRFSSEIVDNTDQHITTQIVKMNLDGSEEEIIQIPN